MLICENCRSASDPCLDCFKLGVKMLNFKANDDDGRMIIAIDFDGTIVEHKYPKIGDPVPHAIEYMKKFQAAGSKLILWTMRDGRELDEAVKYCKDNGVEFFGVNTNPEQSSWTSSKKAYAHLYIDDAAYGCPLIKTNDRLHDRDYVDWSIVGPDVLKKLK